MNKVATIVAPLISVLAWGASASSAGTAQIPTQFTNLQVLSRDIGRPELIETMRQMTADIGVRCNHCHVGPDNLQGMDFASDEKGTKVAARTMMRMTQSINANFVKALPAGAEPVQAVTCVTCHRRSPKPPRPLPALLLETIAADGVQAALDRHERLRAELLDSGLYDFREATLNAVGSRLSEARKLNDAIAVLKRNAELFPRSAGALVAVGLTAIEMRDPATAEEYFRKALAIDPANQAALRGLAAIKR